MNFFEWLWDTLIKSRFVKQIIIFGIIIVGYNLIKDKRPDLIYPLLILFPICLALLLSVYKLIKTRHDPNNFFFHPTSFIIVGTIIGAIFMVGLYFYSQCKSYGVSLDINCVTSIIRNEPPVWKRK